MDQSPRSYLSPRSSRPFTSHSGLVSNKPMHASHSHLAQAFGSPRDRYKAMSVSITSSSATSPSKYFKARSEAIMRSSNRERSGAAGSTPETIMGYNKGGTPMRGVTAFPFEKQHQAYVDQFAPIVASQLVHPFNAITECNAASTAHNIITGSAYKLSAEARSEYKREYHSGFGLPFRTDNPGLRSEEMITVGQCPSVMRSGAPQGGFSAS